MCETDLHKLIKKVPLYQKLIFCPYSDGGFDIALCEDTGTDPIGMIRKLRYPGRPLADMCKNNSLTKAVEIALRTIAPSEPESRVFTDEATGKKYICMEVK